MLFIHEEKHRLVGVVHNHSSLVFAANGMQELFLVVSMMKLKLGLQTQELHYNLRLQSITVRTSDLQTDKPLSQVQRTVTSRLIS